MCGIAGILDPHQSPVRDDVDRMVDALQHRGPDDRGTFFDGPLGFGMRRLSIIDLSTGRQPIFNEDGSLVIVFNGEIYNFQELRDHLLERGHRFATHTDTEAIVHLFEEYGAECVQHLRGMFAFAIWDLRKQELFIARDRFGIKPLYYSWDNGRLVFGSELKSLLTAPGVPGELDRQAVAEYFTYLYVPHQRTLYRAVKKLLPGHYLRVQAGELTTSRYYDFPAPREQPARSDNEWVESFFAEASETIKLHLLSDVPLGAFLSGGIDSSLVVAIMSRLTNRPVETFAIGYADGGEAFDERIYARRVAEACGAHHREFIVTPRMAADSLPVLLERLDEPFGNASVIPNYFLSQFTRQHVTVALSGLGGDEVCAGYERYFGSVLAERIGPLRGLVSSRLGRELIALIPDSKAGFHLPERAKRFAEFAALPLKERYYSFAARFTAAEREDLFAPDFAAPEMLDSGATLFDLYWAEDSSPLRQFMRVDFGTYLVDDLLALSDRTSMAHSLEMRVPFVDHKLVEFFWQVPDRLKLRGLTRKYLLKKAAETVIPHDVIYRRKQGFSVPLSVWFRGPLRSYVEDMLAQEKVSALGIFNPACIRRILDEHFSLKRNHDEKIYTLLSFVAWHK